jgi:hypothetical protein
VGYAFLKEREQRPFYKNQETGEVKWNLPTDRPKVERHHAPAPKPDQSPTTSVETTAAAGTACAPDASAPAPPPSPPTVELKHGDLVSGLTMSEEEILRLNAIADQAMAVLASTQEQAATPSSNLATASTGFIPSGASAPNVLPNMDKKRIQNKRLVGDPSKTINQMKDLTVKQVAASVVFAMENLQQMTVYDTQTKTENNPRCDTFLINYDEMLEVPRKCGDGEKKRKSPQWTVLVPPGATAQSVGSMLVSLGQSMLEGRKSTKKVKFAKKGSSAEPPPPAPPSSFPFEITHSGSAYLNAIYGEEGVNELKKKKRYTTKTSHPTTAPKSTNIAGKKQTKIKENAWV